MTERKLPTGWVWTTLSDVVLPVSKTDPASFERPQFRYIDISAVDGNSQQLNDVPSVAVGSAPSRARQLVRAGDTVFSTVRPYLRKIAWVPEHLDGEIASTGFCVLRPSPAIDSRFLFFAVTRQDFLDEVIAKQRGVSYPAVRPAEVLEIPIPLPPLPEQRRIVDALEDHLSRVNAADASVHAAIARISHLTRCNHRSALSRATNADSVRISEIAKVGSGATPLRSKARYYDGGTIPWATSGDLHAGDIFDVSGRITEVAMQETAVKLWPAGTLLVAMYGEGKTRGTVAELRIASTTNQACAAILIHPEFSDLKRWVRFILRTRYDEMRSQASGGVQPNLSLGRIKEISIPMPDVEIRNAILAEDEANSEATDRLRLAGEQSLARSAALRRSLLRAAFNGDLVDQDPTDEPVAGTLAKTQSRIVPRRRRKAVPAK
ncbi:restriction endonuclease subunit S [Rhodococcus rhodochrous]|uniref:restriction endonuclease subunit S n=1 Tax=Rhodococcus rhodochrous TaxID=1829 RepID=UPI001E3B4C65|nr:restriction endonuclease subunit S [Rhodococcus rhodochrous]MCB8913586.1 restriction endonuclease subunit S [Rhodococcus rhodochrous]